MNLKIHIGQAIENPGDVAIAIAPEHVEREDLGDHRPIAMAPDAARNVAALIVNAADAADAYRKLDS